jgi:hypothetical protein
MMSNGRVAERILVYQMAESMDETPVSGADIIIAPPSLDITSTDEKGNMVVEFEKRRFVYNDWSTAKYSTILDLKKRDNSTTVFHWHDGGVCPLAKDIRFSKEVLREGPCELSECDDAHVTGQEICLIAK